MTESTEDYCRRIGSAGALEERIEQRLTMKLNKPLRCIGGLASIVARLSGQPTTQGHKWECECRRCRPWLWQNDEKTGTDKENTRVNPLEPQVPHYAGQGEGIKIIPTKEPTKKSRKKWDNRGRSTN